MKIFNRIAFVKRSSITGLHLLKDLVYWCQIITMYLLSLQSGRVYLSICPSYWDLYLGTYLPDFKKLILLYVLELIQLGVLEIHEILFRNDVIIHSVISISYFYEISVNFPPDRMDLCFVNVRFRLVT